MKFIKNLALASTAIIATLATPALADDVATVEQVSTPVAPQSVVSDSAPSHRSKIARFGVGVTAGSLGIGPEVSYALNRHFDIRGNATFLSFGAGLSGEQNYHGTAVLTSGGVMVDYHLGGGGFRISTGVRIDGNKARLAGNSANGTVLNGTYYTAQQVGTLRGNADFTTVAPTVTIGYGGNLKHGLKFGIEAGAMFSGSVHLKPITASGGGVADADLGAERQRIQDKVNPYKVYPVLQFSVGYRF